VLKIEWERTDDQGLLVRSMFVWRVKSSSLSHMKLRHQVEM